MTTRGYYNDRASMNEHNDCTVRATARAFVVTYRDAHAALAERGRRHRRGVPYALHVDALATKFGQKVIDVSAAYAGKTVSRTIRELDPSKRYIIRKKRHVFAVCYGRIAGDWMTEGRRHRVLNVWEISRWATV